MSGGYRVTYKSHVRDHFTSTYHFPADGGSRGYFAAALARAYQFRDAIIADGGAAEQPQMYGGAL